MNDKIADIRKIRKKNIQMYHGKPSKVESLVLV